MDIGIKKVPDYLNSLISENLQRINGTGGTTDVEQ
jgi:hypothetical protein